MAWIGNRWVAIRGIMVGLIGEYTMTDVFCEIFVEYANSPLAIWGICANIAGRI